ncbi:hypothetical protein BH11ACT5_BH11ACT5_12630 [soil metagenome]
MMQLTSRDEHMLDWLVVVRMADIDAIRWALGGLKDESLGVPVGVRRANQWIARMSEAALVDRCRPVYRDRQIVWPTRKGTSQTPPTLFRQTMRHELAVAGVSARYLARGFQWSRDSNPRGSQSHLADGVATRGDVVDVIEVELTTKKLARYKHIHGHHAGRLADGSASRIVYLCTPDVARAVAREADRFVFREQREGIVTLPVMDAQGKWVGEEDALWL